MTVKQLFRRFLLAGIDPAGDIFLLRKLLLITSLSAMVIFLFAFFALYNFLHDHLSTALLDLFGLVVYLAATYQLQVHQRLELVTNIFIGFLFCFLLVFANLNQNHSYGLIWTFFFTIFTVLLKGVRTGTAIVVAFYLVLLPSAWLGIGTWQEGHWDLASFIRFTLATLVIYYSAYFNEVSLQRSYGELRRTVKREQEAAAQHTSEVMQLLENKQQLMADISHELRTPLAAMRVNLEAFEDAILPGEEAFPLLQRKLDELNQLIDDIYQLSRADIGALTFRRKPVSLTPLLRDVVDSYRQPARDQGLEIQLGSNLEDGVRIAGDAAKLQQLLCNLLQNSLRHTDAGGKIHLQAGVVNGEVELLLRDSPPGVADEHLPRLFERFYRVDKSRSRLHGGSGLGLAIAKVIVEQHNGTISAGHSPLGGLEIRITFPMMEMEA